MNWWGRLAGLLFLFLVVLLSCEEEVTTIGIKRPNAKFRVTYAEIDVPSSVILFDKLATYNQGITTDGVQRLMVGQYQDNEFGAIRSEIFTQFSPPITNTKIGIDAVFDSMVLQLQTDFYYYGSKSVSDQIIQIHEVSDSIKDVPYYNNSKVAYKPEVLGEKQITIDPIVFDQTIIDNSDNLTTNNKTKSYRIVMDANYARDLFETIRSDSATANDFTKFTGKYKGLAITPTSCDKILGFNPSVSDISLNDVTKMVLYYTESGVQKEVNFVLFPFSTNPVMGFSSIDSDRTGTMLQSLTEPNKDFYPVDNRRFDQSGVGILTKLDFAKYFEYMDTVKNPILNSAELVFENESSDFSPPSAFQFRPMNDENTYKNFLRDTLIDGATTHLDDPEFRSAYLSSCVFNGDGTMDLKGDGGGNSPIYVAAGTTNTISAFLTAFFQDQYAQRENEKRIKYCAFLPVESQFRKSINRFILKDNIKLKIYYTTPVIETTE